MVHPHSWSSLRELEICLPPWNRSHFHLNDPPKPHCLASTYWINVILKTWDEGATFFYCNLSFFPEFFGEFPISSRNNTMPHGVFVGSWVLVEAISKAWRLGRNPLTLVMLELHEKHLWFFKSHEKAVFFTPNFQEFHGEIASYWANFHSQPQLSVDEKMLTTGARRQNALHGSGGRVLAVFWSMTLTMNTMMKRRITMVMRIMIVIEGDMKNEQQS